LVDLGLNFFAEKSLSVRKGMKGESEIRLDFLTLLCYHGYTRAGFSTGLQLPQGLREVTLGEEQGLPIPMTQEALPDRAR
jgi:hypothetical protein